MWLYVESQLITILKNINKASKLFYPNKLLRYFPPSFTIRDPKTSLVRKAFIVGKQVVLILFHVKNEKIINGQSTEDFQHFKMKLKRIFEKAVREKLPDDRILSLFQYNSDEIAIIVKMDEEVDSLFNVEDYIEDIVFSVQSLMDADYEFQTGYMVVEKDIKHTKEAIHRAYQQANAVAEKRLQSKYNELIFEMRKILNQKNIIIMAQPILDVSSSEIYAYEMLTRGPKHTPYENPLHLFTVARQTNMLYELELLVLEKVFEQVSDLGWKNQIFINLTPITIGYLPLVKEISKLLIKYPMVNPEQIILEVTERESIDEIKDICTSIRLLREKGFRFAVDDTGAGYASLHTISKIMPDIIKIDRSVIENIDTNKVKESMLKGLLLIAKETGSLVVAEGIETKEEALILTKNKVDLAQGFYYARPVEMKKAASL